ncbi:hypothetical protein OUZ56_030453 [Daphnia magna]|uniref:RNA-binding protein 18 n=1 Tax=Daphnia magna TaxID=35525 RepID=A0ABQ9ZSL9_9CRUS|nr:hypothetical protein OUZ56_030453 [Daphnia magna]
MNSNTEMDKDDPMLDLYTHPNNDSRIWVGNLDSRVTDKREEAIRARKEFDGKSLLGRTLLVKPARSVQKDDLAGPKTTQLSIPALSGAKDNKHKLNLEQQIKAIESKLKAMENSPATLPDLPPNFVSPLSRMAARPAVQPYPSRSNRSRGSRPYRSRGGHRDRRR